MKRFHIVPQARKARLLEIRPHLIANGLADAWIVSVRFDDGTSQEVRRSQYADIAWQHAEERAARLGLAVVRT